MFIGFYRIKEFTIHISCVSSLEEKIPFIFIGKREIIKIDFIKEGNTWDKIDNSTQVKRHQIMVCILKLVKQEVM
jgi:hypothetical protein